MRPAPTVPKPRRWHVGSPIKNASVAVPVAAASRWPPTSSAPGCHARPDSSGLSPSTATAASCACTSSPHLGHVPLRSLRAETIEALYEHLLTAGRADGTDGLSTKTVLEVHVLLRQILDDAVTRGLLAVNPARQAAPPRHRRDQHRRRMAWTARELATFLTAMAEHRHHRTWWLASHTGVRRSELVGLRWRDIDLEHRRLSITRTIVAVNGRMQPSNGKTANAARTIDLDERTVGILARWRQDHADRFGRVDPELGLALRDDGQPVNPQSISQG